MKGVLKRCVGGMVFVLLPAAALTAGDAERERILAGEREQQRIAGMTTTVATRILDLLKTMRANRASDSETIDRWEHTVRELTVLSQQHMARVVTALRRARAGDERETLDVLRTASLEQREILSRLLALLRAIEKRVAFGRLVDQLEQLVKDQDRVKTRTVETARETLGKPPEQLTDAERERMDDLKDEEESLRQSFGRLGEDLKRLAASEGPSAPPEAAALKRGLQRLEADQADRDMRQAAAALAERRPTDAAAAEAAALKKLQALRDALRQDETDQLRRLGDAAQAVDRLIEEQRQVKGETAQMAGESRPPQPAPADRAQEVLKAQNRLTHATGELAQTTAAVAPKAGRALEGAQAHQREAERHIGERQPAQATAQQQGAIDRLQEAKADLTGERDKLLQRLSGPTPVQRLENAAKDLDALAQGQERARQDSERMAAQASTGKAPTEEQLNRAAAEQRRLAEGTQAVNRDLQQQPSSNDLVKTLNAALKDQEAALEDLQDRKPAEAAADQKQAVEELKKALGNLRYELKLAQQAEAQAQARQQALTSEEAALDALGEAGKRLEDLDRLLARQRTLRDGTADLDRQMKLTPERPALAPPEAKKRAGELAGQERELQDQTAGLRDLMGAMDRDVSKALDAATGPQRAAAGHLDEVRPEPAVGEEDRAIEQLAAAKGHLEKKLEDIVALLKRLEAQRKDQAKGEEENEPEAEAKKRGQAEATISDLLKMASALVDIDRLQSRQQGTKDATAAEADRAAKPEGKPDAAALQRLAAKQKEHTEDAGELVDRMGTFDREKAPGIDQAEDHMRAARQDMDRASDGLRQRQPARAGTDQTKALQDLDLALSATMQAFQEAVQQSQQQLAVLKHSLDPSEYDPFSRPPGSLDPQDLARARRWNVSLPPRIRDEIIAAMGDALPVGFEELLRRYYQDLTQEAWNQLNLRQPK